MIDTDSGGRAGVTSIPRVAKVGRKSSYKISNNLYLYSKLSSLYLHVGLWSITATTSITVILLCKLYIVYTDYTVYRPYYDY